uniref:Uncharacterized protein n=1 Tax=Lepeophtheirus salmonis TaxID=72036 RepID=A0A0K2V6X3_LEPSM
MKKNIKDDKNEHSHNIMMKRTDRQTMNGSLSSPYQFSVQSRKYVFSFFLGFFFLISKNHQKSSTGLVE